MSRRRMVVGFQRVSREGGGEVDGRVDVAKEGRRRVAAAAVFVAGEFLLLCCGFALGRFEELSAQVGVFAYVGAQMRSAFVERVVVACCRRGGRRAALQAVGDGGDVGRRADHEIVVVFAACDGGRGGRVEWRVRVGEGRRGRDV